MKKNLCFLLCLILVFSMILSACDNTGETVSEDSTIPTGSLSGNVTLDIETDTKPLTPEQDAVETPDVSLEATEPEQDTVTTPDDSSDTINPEQNTIEIPDISLDWGLPEHDFNIELEDFDFNQFLQDAKLNFSQEDLAALQQMDPIELAKLIEIRTSLLADLKYAFEKSNIAVYINEKTGEMNLDATVLFDTDEYVVSDEGKKLLKSFMEVYTSVIYSERYNGFISDILIEGHTDSTGEYTYNQTLSQKRADSVLAYILSDECGLSAEHREAFESSVSAKGYSWDRLIYDENGVEDKDASRRVTFRFMIDL